VKCKLKYGDIVLYKDCVGVVRNAAVNQESVSVAWAHNPSDLKYYVPVHTANKFEVLPKDVGMDLIRLYDKEVYLA
jgi:hypothetical protein